MSSDFGSIFHYTGRIDDMKMKISLNRVGPAPGSVNPLDYTNVLCDEISCGWKEVVKRKVPSSYERPEPRLFTVSVEDLSQAKEGTASKKTCMDIYAYLGDLADSDETHFHDAHFCRITAYGTGRTLVFEPPLTASGFRLEGKLGDYLARIQIYEDGFASLTDDLSRMEMFNLPDAGMFELSDENSIQICYNISIKTGRDFGFDAVALQWKIFSQYVKNSKETGATGFFYPNQIDSIWNFSLIFHTNLDISISDISFGITNPILLMEADSEDSWGRQWIAGYGCLNLPLASGTRRERVHFWRPIKTDSVSQLKDFFLGSSVKLDSEKFFRDGRKMFGLQTESSGSVDVEITTVIHSRHFMAKDTLQHVKYGTKLGQIGLKSDLYWRIMKVLLEFEEARQMLLKARKI